jgi:hypothetical protein
MRLGIHAAFAAAFQICKQRYAGCNPHDRLDRKVIHGVLLFALRASLDLVLDQHGLSLAGSRPRAATIETALPIRYFKTSQSG